MNYELFTKIIFANVKAYLNNEKDNNVILTKIASRILMQVNTYLYHNKFTQEEITFLNTYGQSKEFKNIIEREVSFTVFALELMRLFTTLVPKDKRPNLNIADKKLLPGYRTYALDMIKLKHAEPDKYNELKEVMNDTVQMTKEFYDFWFQKCKEREQ